MNNLIVSGFISNELKLTKSQNGKDYVNFVLANKTGFGNYENKNFFSCICFGVTAQNLVKYKKKGDFIVVIGEVNIKEYEKDGVKRQTVNITVNNVEFPPATKVTANDVNRNYDQSSNIPNPYDFDNFAKETGMDGSVNPQQFMKSQEKPYLTNEQLKGLAPSNQFDISSDDLPF